MSKTIKLKATQPQADFHNLETKYSLFVSGFGAGKSEALINQAIIDASESPQALIGLYAPTTDLARLILAPRLCARLDEIGLEYVYNKVENTVKVKGGQFGSFILRTLDRPERIVGYETYRSHIDELDTLPFQKASDAWNKVIARNRQRPKGIKEPFNRVSAYTTPEGFKFAHHRWVTYKNKLYGMIKASTRSNPFLPADYIDALVDTYPAELVKAYIDGEFVNLTSGTVFRSYDRQAHDSNVRPSQEDVLFIGMDFNIDHMAATIWVRRGDKHIVGDEISDAYNTPAVIDIIRARYPNNRVIVYPDSSGKSRDTRGGASESDIALLQEAGFECRFRPTNPRIKDRVMAMNKALEDGKIRVNATACPRTAECLEQQSYDKHGMPDKTSGVDHQNEATTYYIAYVMPVRKPVVDFNIRF